EVAKHITLTRHVYSPLPLAVAENTWKEFSDADKAAVTKAAQEAAAFSRKLVRDSEASQLKEMEAAGAVVAVPVIGPFRDAVAKVYAAARDVYGADVDKILKDAEAIRKAHPAQ
ncbi:MAG: hypothetical protein RLN80_10330, partial [Rhodospirillales bacterium]